MLGVRKGPEGAGAVALCAKDTVPGGKDGASSARMAPGFCVNGVAVPVPVDGEAGACDGGAGGGVRRFLWGMWVLLWLLCEVFFTILGLRARGMGRVRRDVKRTKRWRQGYEGQKGSF